jgi:hypothetical protein
MPSLTVVGIIVLALLIAAALFLMYEIGKHAGEKRETQSPAMLPLYTHPAD